MSFINIDYIHIIKQICCEYRDRFLKKIGHKSFLKPYIYMKYREIEIIEEILHNLKPQKCLEWGAGYSTLYFPRFLERRSEWISIEHDYEWFNKIKILIKKQNVENVKIFYIPPDNLLGIEGIDDVKGKHLDLRTYIEYPARFKPFNFVLIDGRARKDCLTKAYDLITDLGVVILHDANRKRYHQPFHLYKHQILFEDYRIDSGGLWIGSKGLDIEQILDVEKHKFCWRKISKLGNMLKRFFRTEWNKYK